MHTENKFKVSKYTSGLDSAGNNKLISEFKASREDTTAYIWTKLRRTYWSQNLKLPDNMKLSLVE